MKRRSEPYVPRGAYGAAYDPFGPEGEEEIHDNFVVDRAFYDSGSKCGVRGERGHAFGGVGLPPPPQEDPLCRGMGSVGRLVDGKKQTGLLSFKAWVQNLRLGSRPGRGGYQKTIYVPRGL